jgi:hypothetical protein
VVKPAADGVAGAIGRVLERADEGSAGVAYAAALLGQVLVAQGSRLWHISISSR